MISDQEAIGLIIFIGTCFALLGCWLYVAISELNHEKKRARKMHKQNQER